MTRPATFLRALALAAALLLGCTSAMAEPLCLTNARLIPGDGGPPVPRATLCMDEGRVLFATTIDDAPLLEIPEAAEVMDMQGRTVLPGFVDAHLHHVPSGLEGDELDALRRGMLRQGVTTVCDMASPLESMPSLLRQEDGQGRPLPRSIIAGPVLCAPGGYPIGRYGAEYALPVHSEKEAVDAVRMLQQRGARVLKLAFEPGDEDNPLPMLPPEVATAAAEEAKALGMAVRAHVSSPEGLRQALAAGVTAVDHLPLTKDAQQETVEELLQEMAQREVLLVPTLDVLTRSHWENAPLLEVARRFHEYGGRLALGSDAPFLGVAYGVPMRELELLREAGLTALQALQAGASEAALACGVYDRGLLQAGMLADAVVVDGDPLKDLSVLRSPELVILGGRVVFEKGQ